MKKTIFVVIMVIVLALWGQAIAEEAQLQLSVTTSTGLELDSDHHWVVTTTPQPDDAIAGIVIGEYGQYILVAREGPTEYEATLKARITKLEAKTEDKQILMKPHLYQCYDCKKFRWQPILTESLGCARCAVKGNEVGMRYLGYFEDGLAGVTIEEDG